MAQRATAQQAVEILKVYQLRRENVTIYKLVQCLQQEVSDLHDANKKIRDEIEQMQTHSETFNGLTLNNKDQVERLASKVDSLTHKTDRLDANLTKSTNDNTTQNDQIQNAYALLSSKLNVLDARVGDWDKRQNELYTDVTKQIASLQKKIAHDSNPSYNPLTENKLRDFQEGFATLPTTSQYTNLLSRVSESIVESRNDDAGRVSHLAVTLKSICLTDHDIEITSQTVPSCQQIQSETEPAFLSIPTEPIASAITLTNDDWEHGLASLSANHADTFTQPGDIDLDEIINGTGDAGSDSTLTTLNDSFVMLPLQLVQSDEPLDQSTVQQKSVDLITDNCNGCDPVREGEQDRSGGQQGVTPFVEQSSGSPIVPPDIGMTTSHNDGSNHPVKAVTFNTAMVTKQLAIGDVAAETSKQADCIATKKKTKKKISNANPSAPLRRSQRLVEKSQGHIQCDPIQSANVLVQTKTSRAETLTADTKKKAASQPKQTHEVNQQPNKHADDTKVENSDLLPRTPEVSIVRQDGRKDSIAKRIASPSSPLQQKVVLKQSNRLPSKSRARAANVEQRMPSPYNPRPRLIPCKRKADPYDCGWTSDMDVYLPPLKRQAISRVKVDKRQAPISVPLQKSQRESFAPLAKMSILSTSTEEDRRFERW